MAGLADVEQVCVDLGCFGPHSRSGCDALAVVVHAAAGRNELLVLADWHLALDREEMHSLVVVVSD